MKRIVRWLVAVLGMGLLGLMGCSWDASEDEDTWDDSMSWANFSGAYRPGGGTSVVITNTTGGTVAGTLAEVRNEVVGVGNGSDKTFSGTTDGKPIYPGSVTITDGTEQFEDGDKDGNFTGSEGGTGAINYNTGAFTVSFKLQPGSSVDVRATYIYYVGEGGPIDDGGDSTTTKKTISRLTVTQDGNVVTFVDNDGERYTGKMGHLSTTGGSADGQTSGDVVATFEVKGANGITIVGSFEGTYEAPPTGSLGGGEMVDLMMRATWFKGKDSGSLTFMGPGQ
jgi:hypothetical protein